MKHLLIAASVLLMASALRAQCPGCIPVNCSATVPQGGLCDTLLIGMANDSLDEQISFYMPKQIYTTLLPGGGYVQLDKIKITAVVGLPLGLSWESNKSPANEYFPNSGDSLGCVRVCGTPLQADTFRLTVYLLADVTAPVVGQVKNNVQTYNNAVIIILPDTSGGVASFSVTPPIYSSCDPLTLAFEAKIDGSPNPTTYDWDFGNGNTGTGKNPNQQNYSAAGQYPVTLTTTINNYVITEVRVFDTNNSYTGDIEELTALQLPDLYFTVAEVGYTSPSRADSKTATWAGLRIVIPQGTNQITLKVWDDDNGPPFGSQDDSLGRVVINTALGTFLWDDANGTVTNGVIVFGDTVGNVFSETLDIEIGATPTPMLTLSAGDSICGGDTTVVTLSGSDIYQFTWFKDSVFIPSAIDTFFEVTAAGTYWLEAVSLSGCMQISGAVQISVFNYPIVPTVYYNAGTRLLYTTNSSNVPLIQWYRNGASISGANNYSYTVTENGTYTVEYSNVLGCYTVSEQKVVTGITLTSIEEFAGIAVRLYPNPNEGVFHLELPDVESDVSIMIIDNIGRKVYEDKAIAGFEYKRLIDLLNVRSGLYFCRILSGKSQTVEKMLILNSN